MKLSEQSRAILAAALSLVVIIGWSMIYKPTPPPNPVPPHATAAATPAGAAMQGTVAAASATLNKSTPATPSATDTAEKAIVVQSDLYRVEFSNRGAVVHSWQLNKFSDESTPPRTLDLVHADAAQQAGGWPLSLQMDNASLEGAANQGLYLVTSSTGTASDASPTTFTAPVELTFHWSNGQLDVTKKLTFDRSYIVSIESTVLSDGQPVSHRVAWRGGFGDATARNAAAVTTAFAGQAGKITPYATKNLGDASQRAHPAVLPGSFDSVGINDLFFAAAFLPKEPPAGQAVPANLTLAADQISHSATLNGKTTQEILPEVAAGSTSADPLALRAYVGPKDLDALKLIRPPLNGLVQFGWFGFIAEPLFYGLRWLHQYVPNYGWAIVLITIVINMLLYPLKLKSWRSMQKMQKVAPEIRTIQDRYKKYSMRDPRKQEMNKEVMAVYSREGINPMGSCLPTAAQMPIWFGLYRMLNTSLELRHAPWLGWIHDLAGPDPYFILPVAMALVMWAATKMTPTTVTDPSQQRMMALMPLMFGGMFIIFPISSGLALYILTSNLVAVAQQYYLNRASPLKALVKSKKR